MGLPAGWKIELGQIGGGLLADWLKDAEFHNGWKVREEFAAHGLCGWIGTGQISSDRRLQNLTLGSSYHLQNLELGLIEIRLSVILGPECGQ